MRAVVALLCLVFTHVVAGSAHAATILVEASGVWEDVTITPGLLDGSVAAGTPFLLTFRYDDGTPGNPTSTGVTYDFAPGSFDLSLATGNYAFSVKSTSAAALDIANDASFDSIALIAFGFDATGPSAPVFANLSYLNPSNLSLPPGTFSSNALVGLPWASLAGLLDVAFFGSTNGVSTVELAGTATTITVVPEPGTLPLLCVGLGLLAREARRRA